MSPTNLDADIENANWIKTLSWDLPRDAETFLAFLAGSGAATFSTATVVCISLRQLRR